MAYDFEKELNSTQAPPPASSFDFGAELGVSQGGFIPAAKQLVGRGIKGVGQLATDFAGAAPDNAVRQYGQEVIDANPTAIGGLRDIVDKPGKFVSEALGNAAPSVGAAAGLRSLGQAISLIPHPIAKVVGGAISWGGPTLAMALPSYSGIRDAQQEGGEKNSLTDKLAGVGGAVAEGWIEQRLGSERLASQLVSKVGRDKLAQAAVGKSLKQVVGQEAAKGAIAEGITEAVQSPITQLAGYQDPLTKQSLEETAVGSLMGAVGGGVFGGGMSAMVDRTRPDPKTDKGQSQLLSNLTGQDVTVNGGIATYTSPDGESFNVPVASLADHFATGGTLDTLDSAKVTAPKLEALKGTLSYQEIADLRNSDELLREQGVSRRDVDNLLLSQVREIPGAEPLVRDMLETGTVDAQLIDRIKAGEYDPKAEQDWNDQVDLAKATNAAKLQDIQGQTARVQTALQQQEQRYAELARDKAKRDAVQAGLAAYRQQEEDAYNAAEPTPPVTPSLNRQSLEMNSGLGLPVTPDASVLAPTPATAAEQRAERLGTYRDLFSGSTQPQQDIQATIARFETSYADRLNETNSLLAQGQITEAQVRAEKEQAYRELFKTVDLTPQEIASNIQSLESNLRSPITEQQSVMPPVPTTPGQERAEQYADYRELFGGETAAPAGTPPAGSPPPSLSDTSPTGAAPLQAEQGGALPLQEAVPQAAPLWRQAGLDTKAPIALDQVQAKKQTDGSYKLLYRGTENEIFTGQTFKSAPEARAVFKREQTLAQQTANAPDTLFAFLGEVPGLDYDTLAESPPKKQVGIMRTAAKALGLVQHRVKTASGSTLVYELEDATASINKEKVVEGAEVPLPELLNHKQLFTLAPELKGIDVKFANSDNIRAMVSESGVGLPPTAGTGYDILGGQTGSTIYINPKGIEKFSGKKYISLESVLMHEVQHALTGQSELAASATQKRLGLTLAERKADKPTVLFSEGQAQGAPQEQVTTALKSFIGDRAVDNLIRKGKVEIVSDVSQVPNTAKLDARQRKSVLGAYNSGQGKVFLVAGNLDPARVPEIMRHEVVHALLREDSRFMLRREGILKSFDALAKNNASVQAALAKVPAGTAESIRLEEGLAYWVQQESNHKHSLFKRIISAVKSGLARLGIPVGKYSTTDLSRMFTGGMEAWVNQEPEATAIAEVSSQSRQQNYDPDPTESSEVEAAIDGKDILQVADFLANKSPDASYKLIASKVKGVLQKLTDAGVSIDFKVAHLGERIPAALSNARGLSVTSFKDKLSVAVWVNGSDVTGKVGTSYETILHELVHAATQGALYLGNRKVGEGTPVATAASELIKVSNAIVGHFNNRVRESQRGGKELTDFEQRVYGRRVNAIQNQDEILAWALSNKEMQDYLDSIPYSSNQSMWSKFVSSIRTLLGLSSSKDSALSEVLRLGEDILNAPIEQTIDMVASLNGQTSAAYQTSAWETANEQISLDKPNTLFAMADASMQQSSKSLTQKIKDFATDKNLDNAPRWLSIAPLHTLVQTLGKKIPQIKQLSRHLEESEYISNDLINQAYEYIKRADTFTPVIKEALNQAAFKATSYQMSPAKPMLEQEWVPQDKKTKEDKLKGAQMKWKSAGMDTATGETFISAYNKASAAYKAINNEEAERLYGETVTFMRDIRKREYNNLLAYIEKATTGNKEAKESVRTFIGTALPKEQIDAAFKGSEADYKAVLDYVKANTTDKALLKSAASAKDNLSLKLQLLLRATASFKNVKGDYWPLTRIGDYKLEFTDIDGVKVVKHYDTAGARRADEEMFAKTGVKDFLRSKKDRRPRGEVAIPMELMEQLSASVYNQKLAEVDPNDSDAVTEARAEAQEVVEDMNQIWLRWQPETSSLKSSIQRKTVRGADEDMLRASLEYARKHASNIAWSEQGRQIEGTLKNLADTIAEERKQGVDVTSKGMVLTEMRNRLQSIRDAKTGPIASFIGKAGTAMYMTSPSMALVQMTQLPMLTFPKLAVKYGSITKASAALMRATGMSFSKEFAKKKIFGDIAVNTLHEQMRETVTEEVRASEDANLKARAEGKMLGDRLYDDDYVQEKFDGFTPKQQKLFVLREALARNLLDISASHEAYALEQGKNPNGVGSRVFNLAMQPMKLSEMASRKAAILATMELAQGQGKSFKRIMNNVSEVVNDTLFSYSKANKPAVLQGGTAKVLAMFQWYRIMTALRMGMLAKRSFAAETPEIKAAARKEFIGIMGMTTVLAGSLGLPLMKQVFAALDALADDDEPRDSALEFRQWAMDRLGPTWGEAFTHGLPAAFLGVNASKRIGLGDVYGFQSEPPSRLHGKELAAWWAANQLGPAFGIVQGGFQGYDHFSKGEYMKGLEAAMPKPLKDGLRAARVMQEGDVKSLTGRRTLAESEMTADAVILLALGLSPSEIAAANKVGMSKSRIGAQLTERRGRVIDVMVQALEGDGDIEKARETLVTYNKKLPRFAIRGGDIRSALIRKMKEDRGIESRRDQLISSQYGL